MTPRQLEHLKAQLRLGQAPAKPSVYPPRWGTEDLERQVEELEKKIRALEKLVERRWEAG